MTDQSALFLDGIPVDRVLAALAAAAGNEVESGKLASPESSAALAVNCFGWFIDRPRDLPSFPPLADIDWPALKVDVECQMRFPWSGGRHPWLDARIETAKHLIGVESKRFEPFRDKKTVNLSNAYDRDEWGPRMGGFTTMRDTLRAGLQPYSFLDAAQLVKHAFGLVTEARRTAKSPILLYLYAEPETRGRKAIGAEAHMLHRSEISRFSQAVKGSEVRFESCSYREWLIGWTGVAKSHSNAIAKRFGP